METREIIDRYDTLSRELRIALSTMERKSKIYELKKEIIGLQSQCKHIDNNFNWVIVDGNCPYCGKKLY